MDPFLSFLAILLGIFILVVLPIGFPLLWARVSRLQTLIDKDEGHFADLIKRVHHLEKQLEELPKILPRLKALEEGIHARAGDVASAKTEAAAEKASPASTPGVIPAPGTVPPTVPVPPPAAVHPPIATPTALKPATPLATVVIPPAPAVPPAASIPPPGAVPAPTAAAPPVAPVSASPPAGVPPVKTPATPVAQTPPATTAPPQKPVAAPPARPSVPAASAKVFTPTSTLISPQPTPARPTRQEISRKAFDLEERLGTNWLSKLGVIILVFGVVFYLAYELSNMGPAGKDLLGVAVSAALLAGGIYLEKKTRYELLGHTVIGGGWALGFFVAYAMYHVSAARVLDSQLVDLVLMLAVAAAMVAHTLRYNSQTVTGLAFLLGFSTVSISRETVYSLTAGAILAAGLVIICLRRRWYELEVFGILASFLNHFLWLREILAGVGMPRHMFPEFIPSTMLLAFYWVAFRASYILRREPSEQEEGISTLAALLNTGLLLGLLKYQSVRPELAFWALLVIGAVELALGQLPQIKARRTAFITLSTVGTSLVVAAVPFRYTGNNLSALWLVEAEALFLVGAFIPEIIFRHFGVATAVLTSMHLLFVDAWAVAEARAGGDEPAEYRLATLCGIAVVIFYTNAHWAARKWKTLFTTEFERRYLAMLSYLAALLALAGAWLAFPGAWTAVAWAALVLAAAVAAEQFELRELWVQSQIFAIVSSVWAVARNLEAAEPWHEVTLRLATIGLVAALVYIASRPLGRAKFEYSREASAAYTWAASLLVALLAWKELPAHWVAVAWAGFGLALLVVGRVLKRGELAWQAHCLAAAAVTSALLNNLEITRTWHGFTLRLITVSLTALLLYVSVRWAAMAESQYAAWISAGYTWAGTLLVALLGWQELESAWTPVSWAAFALVLMLVGRGLKRGELRLQAHCLAAAAFVWALVVNFGSTGQFHGVSLRLVTVSAIAVILYLATRWSAEQTSEYAEHISAAYSWAASALVTTLVWYELRAPSVALGWALFGLVMFELGWVRGSPSLRMQAYFAFTAAFLRIFFVNLNAQTAPGELSVRLYTTLPIAAACYYAYGRIASGTEKYDEMEQRHSIAPWLNYMGVLAVAGLIRFELHPDWVVAGWAAMVVVLLAAALRSGTDMFLHQGLLLGIAVLFRTVFYNFELPRYYAPGLWTKPVVTVGAACGLLLASLPLAFRMRKKAPQADAAAESRFTAFCKGVVWRPEQLLFFVPVGLLTWLLMLEMRKGLITLAWGVEGLAVFVLALVAKERSFRLTGLALLLLCVGKIVVVDVWTLGPADRYLTFIALGSALLAVSFLYTRYREALREYL